MQNDFVYDLAIMVVIIAFTIAGFVVGYNYNRPDRQKVHDEAIALVIQAIGDGAITLNTNRINELLKEE